ncbi:hypothetical protein ACS8E9_15930 [Pseudomonas neustonica]|uniref:hypothetical protein n=1 Tax=Pseudomonas neustonica TaxID=2487346 RepID=UPI003F45739B
MSQHSRQETEERIKELRESLNQLENQLAHHQDNDESQHDLIEHLDEFIDAVDHKVLSLRTFWNSLKSEWQKGRN